MHLRVVNKENGESACDIVALSHRYRGACLFTGWYVNFVGEVL